MGHFTDKKIDDLATAYFWYNDGRKAVMSCGMCSGVKGSRFFVYGTKGKIEVPIVFNDCGEKVITVETEKGVRKITEEVPNNYTSKWKNSKILLKKAKNQS